MWREGCQCLVTLFAAVHDGGMETVAQVVRKPELFMGAIDFNRLERGVKNHLAMFAVPNVCLQFGAQLRAQFIVDQVVEQGHKLGAGHFSTPFFLWK
jgi:hypothetical protein